MKMTPASNSGYSVFTQLGSRALIDGDYVQYCGRPVTDVQYNKWRKHYTMEALQLNTRYGESFCNYFKIINNIIFYDTDWERCDKNIRKYHIDG